MTNNHMSEVAFVKVTVAHHDGTASHDTWINLARVRRMTRDAARNNSSIAVTHIYSGDPLNDMPAIVLETPEQIIDQYKRGGWA